MTNTTRYVVRDDSDSSDEDNRYSSLLGIDTSTSDNEAPPTIDPEVSRRLVLLSMSNTINNNSDSNTGRVGQSGATTSSGTTKRMHIDTSKAVSELLRLFVVEAHQRATLLVSFVDVVAVVEFSSIDFFYEFAQVCL